MTGLEVVEVNITVSDVKLPVRRTTTRSHSCVDSGRREEEDTMN